MEATITNLLTDYKMNTHKSNFIKLYFKLFIKPINAFDEIFASDKKLKYGFLAFLIPAFGYTLFYIMAYFAGGSPSTFKPWLNLPIEDYFRYDIFLTFPGYFLSWVGAASVVYLVSCLMNGKGNFDDVLATIGFGFGVATWSSLLHDLTDAFLSVIGVIDMREYERLLNGPTFWRAASYTLHHLFYLVYSAIFHWDKKVPRF
jgi:hypothetical protein